MEDSDCASARPLREPSSLAISNRVPSALKRPPARGRCQGQLSGLPFAALFPWGAILYFDFERLIDFLDREQRRRSDPDCPRA